MTPTALPMKCLCCKVILIGRRGKAHQCLWPRLGVGLALTFRQSHNQPVQLVSQPNLAGQPAVSLRAPHRFEQRKLDLGIGSPRQVKPFQVNEDVACPAGCLPTAKSIDTWHSVVAG